MRQPLAFKGDLLLKSAAVSKAAGYAVAALIFAAIGVVVGYLVYAAPGQAVSFEYWLRSPARYGPWLIGGALSGLGLRFLTVHR